MTTWTEELKKEVIEEYLSNEPTPENSSEIVKELAETRELSPNGVRQVLVQAGVYVKKDATTTNTKTKVDSSTKDAPKRVSKESQVAALRAAIEKKGKDVDEDILSKLTGKAAAYFASVIG
jgi:hypothetical protein